MGTAIVGIVGSLLGVALGFLGQSLQARREHRWAIDNKKRETYAEFLRSISASYAQAKSEAGYHQTNKSETKSDQSNTPEAKSDRGNTLDAMSHLNHKPEDANLLAARASIELLAKQTISERASRLSERVIEVHEKLRSGDPSAEKDVSDVNNARLELIDLFQHDLGILSGDQRASSQVHVMGTPDPIPYGTAVVDHERPLVIVVSGPYVAPDKSDPSP